MSIYKPLTSREFTKPLCEALGLDANKVQRIVIDVDVSSIVKVYVQMIADTKMLDVLQSLEGVQIKFIGAEDARP